MPVTPEMLVVGPSPPSPRASAADVEAAGAFASAWCRSSCISVNDHQVEPHASHSPSVDYDIPKIRVWISERL